jgi:hypothetical protein
MNIDFDEIKDQLHDARVFGFFFDNDREKFKFDFYLYIQLFGEFEKGAYHLKRGLLRFGDASIRILSIKDDISRGQYFITEFNITQIDKESYRFDIVFNSDDVELSLTAVDFELIVSERVELSSDQYLMSDWGKLLKP